VKVPLRSILALKFVPARWRVPCFAMIGVLAGIGATTAHVSRAASYLSKEPEACANCHVMSTSYATWQRSSHANVATCVDCHLPQDSFLHKYQRKARDGAVHSFVFTFRLEPEVIRMSSGAVPVVEANCRRCHADLVGQVHLREWQEGDNRCWDCHREVPHGRTRSLSAAPRVMAPQLPAVLDLQGYQSIGGRTPRPANQERTHE
jgi:cytochrome c nitrite reductase small subunit